MKTTHIVIPIGVAAPGTPVPSLLRHSIDSIQRQTEKDYILTVASDTDVSQEIKDILKEKKVNVKWFEPGTFFRRGGIWKKITDCWKETDSKYLAFLHYDDLWDDNKLEKQIEVMEEKNIGCSWAECFYINDTGQIISGDLSTWSYFSKETVGSRTAAFAHACVMRKQDFFDSGIMEFENTWSACFEDIFTLYAQTTTGCKATGARFFWRDHSMSMTNTLCQWTAPASPWRDEVIRQQSQGEYLDAEVSADHRMIIEKSRAIYEQLKNKF